MSNCGCVVGSPLAPCPMPQLGRDWPDVTCILLPEFAHFVLADASAPSLGRVAWWWATRRAKAARCAAAAAAPPFRPVCCFSRPVAASGASGASRAPRQLCMTDSGRRSGWARRTTCRDTLRGLVRRPINGLIVPQHLSVLCVPVRCPAADGQGMTSTVAATVSRARLASRRRSSLLSEMLGAARRAAGGAAGRPAVGGWSTARDRDRVVVPACS